MPVILPDVEVINSIIKTTAKEEILSRYKHLKIKEIGHKAFGEIVTEADIQSELRLTDQLTSLVPNSTVVGEEGYSKDKGILRRFADNHPVWIELLIHQMGPHIPNRSFGHL